MPAGFGDAFVFALVLVDNIIYRTFETFGMPGKMIPEMMGQVDDKWRMLPVFYRLNICVNRFISSCLETASVSGAPVPKT